MVFLLRNLVGRQTSYRWIARRAYSSDITASAMVYSEYGQPSQVLK